MFIEKILGRFNGNSELIGMVFNHSEEYYQKQIVYFSTSLQINTPNNSFSKDGNNDLIPLLKQGASYLALDKNENSFIDDGSGAGIVNSIDIVI